MKFRVQAIDESGRPREFVVRADSEDAAREALLADAVFPKRIEPADDDEKVTYVSRTKVEERLASARREAGPAPAVAPDRIPHDAPVFRTAFTDGRSAQAAWLAVPGPGKVMAALGSRDAKPIVLTRDEVEDARLAGFPLRVLRIFALDGRLFEFRAGVLFSHPVAKAARKALSRK